MSPTLAIVPAKRHSQGVPDKNWKPITPDGRNCVGLAVKLGLAVCDRMVLSTDMPADLVHGDTDGPVYHVARRPPDLPDTMLAVVQHALEQVPGPDDEIIVLLQPSSPLRTTETVRQAIQMLEDDPDATSVVSVSPSYPAEWTLVVEPRGTLRPVRSEFHLMASRRQDCEPSYKRDGVVYAFRRSQVERYGDIYGCEVQPLFTTPAESLSIDTPEDWEEAVRRLASASGGSAVGASHSPAPRPSSVGS